MIINRITEIDLISTSLGSVFVSLVNDAIKDGWQPYGHLIHNDEGVYRLVVVKYANDK